MKLKTNNRTKMFMLYILLMGLYIVTSTANAVQTDALLNGTPVPNLSAAQDQQLYFSLDVPEGASNLKFTISGGTGDADLYVKFGALPTLTDYDARPYLDGSEETANIPNVQTGTYYVMVQAYFAFSGLSLVGEYTPPSGGGHTKPRVTTLENGVALQGLSAVQDQQLYFSLEVPTGANSLSFSTSGGNGDVDLYVKYGALPTLSDYDARPYKDGNNETANITNIKAGTYYVMLHGYLAFSVVSLVGQYSLPPQPVTVDYVVESLHPYDFENVNGSDSYAVTDLNAESIVLHFEKLDLESGDFIYLKDIKGSIIATLSSSDNGSDFVAPPVPGNTVNIILAKNNTTSPFLPYGFKIDRYQYFPLLVDVPTEIFTEEFPVSYIKDEIAFEDSEFYLRRQYKQYGDYYLTHWNLTDRGLIQESEIRYKALANVPEYHVIGKGALDVMDGQVIMADSKYLHNVRSGENVRLLSLYPNTPETSYHLQSDNRGYIYVSIGTANGSPVPSAHSLQIINSRTFSRRLEHVFDRASALDYGGGPIHVDEKYLVLANGHRNKILSYDVSNPYDPKLMANIAYDSPVYTASWFRPLVIGEHVFLPGHETSGIPHQLFAHGGTITSYNLLTGTETSQLTLPEHVLFSHANRYVDGNIIYVNGEGKGTSTGEPENKIYVIDASDPSAMKLLDTIVVSTSATNIDIELIRKIGNRLYVVFDKTLRTILLPSGYPMQ